VAVAGSARACSATEEACLRSAAAAAAVVVVVVVVVVSMPMCDPHCIATPLKRSDDGVQAQGIDKKERKSMEMNETERQWLLEPYSDTFEGECLPCDQHRPLAPASQPASRSALSFTLSPPLLAQRLDRKRGR
jgi:hypothetical protein